MRAARFHGGEKTEIVDTPMPDLESGEVLMKVAYRGLCGSEKQGDRHGFDLIPGHEVGGTIVAANGTDVAVGTRAAAYINVHCGTCRYCLRGETNRCLSSRGLLGFTKPFDGGYADYMAVPARDVLPVDPAIGLDDAILLLDTIATASHGLRLGQAESSTQAWVIGCGPLGLGTVAGLRAFGVPEVFAADLSSVRLETAADLGATPICPDDSIGTDSLELIVEAAGATQTIVQAITAVTPGGRMVMLGEVWTPWEFQPSVSTVPKDYSRIRSWYFPISEHAETQHMLLDGKVDSSRLISHTFPLDQRSAAFQLLVSGKTRTVLAEVDG